MAARSEQRQKKTSPGKKKGGGSERSSSVLSAVGSAVGSEALLDLVERLGLVDLILGRVRAKIEDTDVDEVMEEVTDYLRRNPEVLVVTLGAVTVATGLLVWLNNRREWDGSERRRTGAATSAPGRAKRATAARTARDEDDE
jgi:hypothetical protein